MKCKHENVTDKFGETTHDHIGDIVYEVEYRECLDCGAWLALGPSNDEGCGVEIRAAEIAAGNDRHALSTRFDFIGVEWEGWRGKETINLHVEFPDGTERDDADVPLNLDSPNWRAGYLARVIATHDDQLRRELEGE